MRRSLYYVRVQWVSSLGTNLETLLRNLLDEKNVVDTQVTRPDDTLIELAHKRSEANEPLFLHCVSYAPGRLAGLVKQVDATSTTGELASVPPPDGHEFLSGSCVALVQGDNVIFCHDDLKVETFVFFLHQLAKQNDRPNSEMMYQLAAVANREVLSKIHSEGVKSIGIDATLDEYDPDGMLFENLSGHLKNSVLETLRSLWEKDKNFGDIQSEDFQNINAKIVLTLDKRFKAGVSQEVFDTAAQQALDSQEPGFTIRTRDNSVFTHDSIKLAKSIEIPLEHESIAYAAAWNEQEQYLDELRSRGYLDA